MARALDFLFFSDKHLVDTLKNSAQTYLLWIGVFFLISCMQPIHSGGDTASSILPKYNTEIDLAAQKIFSDKCNSCHGSSSPGYGGISYMDDIPSMILNGIVVPGNPSASLVHTEIESGSMPTTGSLSPEDQQTISSWIESLENRSPSNGDDEGAPTYSEIYTSILGPKCVGCHGSSGGVSLVTYDDTLNLVWAGSPSVSLLWQVVESGDMPKGGPALTQSEVDALAAWIAAGALNN